jgi:hypothetical protein
LLHHRHAGPRSSEECLPPRGARGVAWRRSS